MVKIHFAGMDGEIKATIAKNVAGINYSLYSVFQWIYNKNDVPILDKNHALFIDQKTSKHVIQDSGLFTLMFGAKRGTPITKEYLTDWQDRLIDFVVSNGITASCVEIDCQKVLGVKEAWYFRDRMKDKLPNEQINVFHYEDGKTGLDSMIKFSDYIAISVPELRLIKRKTYKNDVCHLVDYIKDKKPEIKIHLLGCTEIGILSKNREATSADSSSWLYGIKHNDFGAGTKQRGKRENINKEYFEEYKRRTEELAKEYGRTFTQKSAEYTALLGIDAKIYKQEFEKYVGNQD